MLSDWFSAALQTSRKCERYIYSNIIWGKMRFENLDIGKIQTAFSPAREIEDPKLFVGRGEEIKDSILAIQNPGGFIAIFGLRGVGKSSIANQVKLIAEGDVTLVNSLKMNRLIPSKGFNFIVNYYRSDGFVENIGDLFKRMLFGDDKNSSLFSYTKSGEKKLEEFKRVVSVDGGANILGAKIGAKGQEESKYTPYISDDLIQQFRSLLGTIRKDNQKKDGLLILVDEFDTIKDKAGFASIVKACSSDFVKFGVIGIASNISELIKDHSSIGRQIDFIRVPLMPEYEVLQIMKKAEWRIGNAITFDDSALNDISAKSEGFPYFAHLLGKEAMLMAFQRDSQKVTHEDITALYQKISDGRLNNIFEDVYHESVKNSEQRELLLKLFAENKDNEMFSEPIYTEAKEFGVTNPSQLMKQLTSPDNSMTTPVLTKVRDRHYRFTDPVFKVYARIRNWKFN
jgi:AAA+ ATPase superfamily predicted ATPase